ncbi:MAG: SprT-like domain-containing protein [Chitinophagales bacterium]|nr:SprT-like domain-containing protein [Chitinophagales bacterium]
MPKVEKPMQTLAEFLPEGSFDSVVAYIHQFKVHLTVTKKRKTILGDYRHAGIAGNHKISVNGNLNKYEFLITLLHEIAHLLTYEQFKNKVEPHGKEWKYLYSRLLYDFIEKKIFPTELEIALRKYITNPAATANGETDLLIVLRKYNTIKKEGYSIVEHIGTNSLFETDKGKVFKKGNKRRKRFECLEIATGKIYLFNPLAEVRIVES